MTTPKPQSAHPSLTKRLCQQLREGWRQAKAAPMLPVYSLLCYAVFVLSEVLPHHHVPQVTRLFFPLIVFAYIVRHRVVPLVHFDFTRLLLYLSPLAFFVCHYPLSVHPPYLSMLALLYLVGIAGLVLADGSSCGEGPTVCTGYDVCFRLLLSLLFSGVVAALLYGMLLALAAIFECTLPRAVIRSLCAAPFFLMAPQIYAQYTGKGTDRLSQTHVLGVLLRRVLLPALMLYLLITLLYLGKAFIFRRTPEGTVAYMMTALYIVGMLVCSARYLPDKSGELSRQFSKVVTMGQVNHRDDFTKPSHRGAELIFRLFRVGMIGVCGLCIWALQVRVCHYGWTADRVLLAVSIVLMLCSLGLMFFSPRHLYRGTLWCAVCLSLLTFYTALPQRISFRSQQNILLHHARELGILSADESQLLPMPEIKKRVAAGNAALRQVYGAHTYLRWNKEGEAVPFGDVKWDRSYLYTGQQGGGSIRHAFLQHDMLELPMQRYRRFYLCTEELQPGAFSNTAEEDVVLPLPMGDTLRLNKAGLVRFIEHTPYWRGGAQSRPLLWRCGRFELVISEVFLRQKEGRADSTAWRIHDVRLKGVGELTEAAAKNPMNEIETVDKEP